MHSLIRQPRLNQIQGARCDLGCVCVLLIVTLVRQRRSNVVAAGY